MKTVLIKVLDLKDKQFPVQLYVDDGNDSWDKRPVANSIIREDLTLDNPVEDPFNEGVPLDEASVKQFFSESGEGDAKRFNALGLYLYRLLFQGEIKKNWDELTKRYLGKPAGTEGRRTVLDIQPQRLQALPWELMGEDGSLFLDIDNPFSRGGRIEFNRDIPPHVWPLRALIIVGSAEDDHTIDADLEVESIAGALRDSSRTIEVDIMRRPSKSELFKQYEEFQPHIIHFIGHGGLDEAEDDPHGRPYLRLYDKKSPQNWTIDEIANLRNTSWAASFAFINACRSGDSIGVHGTLTIADAFVKARIPCVLSMLGDVKEQAAQTFVAGVYEALARNSPLDQAVAKARFNVSRCTNIGLGTKQWALASLFLSVPPDKVLAFDYKIDPTTRKLIRDDPEFGKLHTFVDRLQPRLMISKCIDPRTKIDPADESFLAVSGDGKVGKSDMVKLFLECCAMRGLRVSWVNLSKGQSSSTILDVLRSIRDGDPSLNSLLSPALDEHGEFSQFNWELERVLNPGKSNEDVSVNPRYIEGEKSKKKTSLSGSEDLIPHLFSLFRNGLQKAAGDAPLIITLDNIDISPKEDFYSVLIPYLVLPIKQGKVNNVKLILVLPGDGKLDQLSHYVPVPVRDFEKDDLVPLALEFFRYNKNKFDKDRFEKTRQMVKRVANALCEGDKETWKPEVLNDVLKMAKNFTN